MRTFSIGGTLAITLSAPFDPTPRVADPSPLPIRTSDRPS